MILNVYTIIVYASELVCNAIFDLMPYQIFVYATTMLPIPIILSYYGQKLIGLTEYFMK